MGERGANATPPAPGSREPGSQSSADAPHSKTPVGVGVLPGRKIGRYKLLFPIGAGGMAQVWAARPDSAGLARTVAIKLVLPDFGMDPEYERMFVDEAMVASSIHHPNVCETLELGRDGDLLFMVLEWVAGESLSGLLQKGPGELKPLPDGVAARIVADGCAGLHAAHEAIGPDGQPLGIVHRDVSPPNILISMHGHVKVSDFGIAKARYQLHSKTRTGEIKGKFAYIPPEQILGRGVDRRADIYAMGCVLYCATLGLRPFGSGASALGKIVQSKYMLPSAIRKGYPEALEQIIVRALAPDPNKRFQTADEFRNALEEWLMSRSELVVESEIARIVNERLSPERRTVIEAARNTARALPEALAYRLLSRKDKTSTPTANSQVFSNPLVPGSSSQSFSSPRVPKQRLGTPQPPPYAPPLDQDPDATPTWRPPVKSHDEGTGPSNPQSSPGFDFMEADSTVRDRVGKVILSSRPPKKSGNR
jgi:eukaryotic-like serine/threonine-protein kinase